MMFKKKIKRGIVYTTLLVLTGCQVGPRHVRPPVEMEQTWHAAAITDPQMETFSNCQPLAIGQLFDDPLLQQYLQWLAWQNYDAKLAYAKIREAFALRQIATAKLFPMLDTRIAYNRSKPAGRILKTPASPTTAGSPLGGVPLNLTQQTFLADFDALWEVDLFGGKRSEIESATAFIQMEVASYQDVLLSLSAEFTRTFLELRRAQNNLLLLNEEIQLVTDEKQATEERLTHGLDTELSLLESQFKLDQLASQIPLLEGEVLSLIYRLSVLMGRPPDTLFTELNQCIEIPRIQDAIPIGFPSELLRRRPDIRLAERETARATADLGVAVADLFPKLTLTGNYGFQNLHLGNAKGQGRSWGYGGNLLTPIFHWGSLRANVRRYEWISKEALYSYEQAVLTALEESESAIARYLKSQNTLEETERAYTSSQQLLNHTKDLYSSGLANRLQMLSRQRLTIQSKRQWVNAQIDTRTQLIALYKALGGSWQCVL